MKATLPFVKAFGEPEPRTGLEIEFDSGPAAQAWADAAGSIGAGYFQNRFVFLFGEGLEELIPCLEAWAFLVPPSPMRRVVGYNAYGSLLTLEDGSDPLSEVQLLDPFRVVFWGRRFNLFNLVNHWLPGRRIPHFLDDELYQAALGGGGSLPPRYILAPQRPEPLGGKLTASNVEIEEIVSYYQSTGPIYAEAVARARREHTPQSRTRRVRSKPPKTRLASSKRKRR